MRSTAFRPRGMRADCSMGSRCMKYMGSKRVMLQNGFGSAILEASKKSKRVVDLFSGSGAVAWYAAERVDQPVLAVDLQAYSAILANAVIGRTEALDLGELERQWLAPALRSARRSKQWKASGSYRGVSRSEVRRARDLCRDGSGGVIWSAYGGHYFSPRQALLFDWALKRLPLDESLRSAGKAALIAAASHCAAAPGHTAQPFQPTKTALPYIGTAWRKDPLDYARNWLLSISGRFAKTKGTARVADALKEAVNLDAGDLVVIDPPYSAVQYSRFYHVLEVIARWDSDLELGVAGVGRYPPSEMRPRSDFSLKTRSSQAIEELLDELGDVGCRVLITFPDAVCSNGLSGAAIADMARSRFKVKTKTVEGRFSTLGGNNSVRAARHSSAEMILSLSPRRVGRD